MPKICFSFHVHQPYRLAPYSFFDSGRSANFFDHQGTIAALQYSCDQRFLPLCGAFHRLQARIGPDFKAALYLSGTTLELMRAHHTASLQAIRNLIASGCVELLAGPYYNSLLVQSTEFREQVQLQSEVVRELFGVTPRILCDREGIVQKTVQGAALHTKQGLRELLAECRQEATAAEVLILSIDPKDLFLATNDRCDDMISLESLVMAFQHERTLTLVDPSCVVSELGETAELIPQRIFQGGGMYIENSMQRKALNELYSEESRVRIPREIWRRLQDREYLLHMRIRREDSQNVKDQWGGFASPYDAFIVFMNILRGAATPVAERNGQASGF